MQQNRCQCGCNNNMNMQSAADMRASANCQCEYKNMQQTGNPVNCQCEYKNMQQTGNSSGYHCALKEYNSAMKDEIDWGCYPIAMAYVPWQKWKCVYDAEEGFMSGTIFPELDLPFYGESYACRMGGK